MPAETEDLLLRQLPHSVEAEQAVLGSMLIDSRCIPDVMDRLKPDDFYVKQNREIFETILVMFGYSLAVDPVTVLEQMKLNGTYDETQSRSYIIQLMDSTPTAANVGRYIDILKDNSLLRQLAEAASDITEQIQKHSETGQNMLDLAEQRIYSIRHDQAAKGLTPISEVLIDVYDHLEELASSDSDIPGLSTGLHDLDAAIAGLNRSDLILLAARPGMGKTSMALNILLHAGKKSGKKIAFFSLEMSREQLAMRLISGECFVDNKKLITGRLDSDDWDKIASASDVLTQSTILLDDDSTVTVADILARCRRVEDLGLIIVDYLQLMQSAGGRTRPGDNRQNIVTEISRSLKLMAKELNVPVLCLSQLSRANERREDKRPMLSDLRESGAIEQDADIVLFLYREGYYNKAAENPNLAECIVAKNRHGETRTVNLQWLPEFTTFSDIEWQHRE